MRGGRINLLEVAADLAEPAATADGREQRSIYRGRGWPRLLPVAIWRFDKGGGSVLRPDIGAAQVGARLAIPTRALYWLCRMLDGGCDPLYVARRVVRMAM